MKLYVADYLGDTHHLNAAEHGAYLLLLMGMWRSGGTLPANDANLARLARCSPEEWAQIKGAVLPFFRRSRGRITQNRLAVEMAKYESISCKRSNAGKTGASKKHNLNNMDGMANADQLPKKPEAIATITRTITKEESNDSSKSDANASSCARLRSTDFDEFWLAYPKKKGKGSARPAFKRARGKAEQARIMAGLAQANAAWRDIEPRFIPHPTTWLNDERWLDEPEQSAAPRAVHDPAFAAFALETFRKARDA